MNKKKFSRILYEYLMNTVAGLANAFSVHLFVNPNKLVPGGFTGLASALYYFFPSVGISTLYILLNIPLLICSIIFVKGDFTAKTIWATIVCTLALKYIPANLIFTSSKLIAVIFGGVCVGFAMYIAALYGGSNGGTEVIAKIVAKKRPEIDLSKVILISNIAILLIGSFLLVGFKGESVWVAVYSAIYALCGATFMGMLSRGFDHAQKFLVITDKYQQMADVITKKFKRGVTLVDMTDENGELRKCKMLVVLCQFRQATILRQIIKRIDKESFTIVKDIQDVFSRPSFNRSYRYDKQTKN